MVQSLIHYSSFDTFFPRIAMLEASHLANVSVGKLSFARALTETRLFFQLLLSSGKKSLGFYLGSFGKVLCKISCEDQAKPTIFMGSAAVSKKEPRFGAQASGT